MTASLSGQAANMPGTNRTSRLGENNAATSRMGIDEQYGQSKTLGSNLSTTTNGWNVGGIWGNGTLGSSFGPASRERSRNRESGAFSGGVSEVIEGKTGSGSLLASSETDTWTRRSPWASSDANATRRSSGVSPARQRSSQPYLDNSQPANHFVSNSRTGLSANDAITRSASLQMDVSPANMVNFSSDAFLNGYGAFDRVSGNSHRASDSMFTNNWTECQNPHSPSDDRRSVSEYFASSSAAASRSGSLPPSRHGADPAQLSQLPDAIARLPQSQAGPGSRGHASSLSSHSSRAFPERTNSFPNEAVPMFSRLSLDNGVQPLNLYHRQTTSNTSALAFLGQHDQRFSRQSMTEQAPEDGIMGLQESFTPEGYPYNQVQDALTAYNMGRLADRGGLTQADSDYRQSPFYSTGGTPPVFDHLYPSRGNQSRASPSGHSALLERKLRDLQQGQQAAYLNPQYSQMFQVPQYRGQFNPYQYAAATPMQFNGIPQTLQVSTVPPIVAIEAPRGPKEQDAGQGLRSALLEEFKSNNKGSRRYELKDIYDHVVEFSGDQHGSRFIQQKLETANSDEKERVFREIQTNSMQLMQDVFGNYVIQKFFEHGDQSQKKILANRMKGQVLNLSLQMYGCRVVQKALEHILTDQQASLVKELEHSVLRCVKDQNGNHVIQKAIERVPAEHIQFIIQAFTGQVAALATHPYGCRVIQRMLEHCEDDARNAILQELHACGTNLISDQYGNYVTQHIIEHGRPEDRAKIIELVKGYLLNFSKHKFASNVVEKCLVFGSDDQRREIMLKVVEKPEGPGQKESNALALIKDNYGNYVIQKLLDVLGPADHQTLVDAMTPELLKAKRIVAGKQVLAVEKKMHRFEKKIDSPLEVPARMSTQNESAIPTVPIIDTSAAATPPPPLTADAQSLRSDSIPSTTMSAVDEPVTGLMSPIGSKTPSVVVPQIGVTETTE